MRLVYSIMVPVFNEQENLAEFYRRLTAVMTKIGGPYEIVLVDDGSEDGSLGIIRKLHQSDRKVKCLSLSRNFGQQAAITAGLEAASGEVVVTMDADLQDPPELLPEFFSKLGEGYDVVYGVSIKRDDPLVRRLLFNLYYAAMDRMSPVKFPRHAGIFAVMTRDVVAVLLQLTERNRFVPALRSWVGFRQSGIPYEKPRRFAGREAQSLSKLFRMGFDSLFSFSYVPLRLATYLGLVVSFLAFLVIVNVLYQKLVAGTAILGWASPLVSILFIGGVQLIILGIIGEYLGRIYDEVKRRPYYIVSEKIGF